MKKGLSLTELCQEIERQHENKKDAVVKSEMLHVAHRDGFEMDILAPERYNPVESTSRLGDFALAQVCEWGGIPAKYRDRLREADPSFLADNINFWLAGKDQDRMVRILDGRVRAFLSPRYQRVDNIGVAKNILPIIADKKEELGLEIVSCDVTEKSLYIKIISHKLAGEVKRGDVVNAGVIIRNSEIGLGPASVADFIGRLVCDNGMIVETTFRKAHIGARAEIGDSSYKYLSNEALEADDTAVMLKMRDVVAGSLTQEALDARISTMREAAGVKVKGSPEKAIEYLAQSTGVSLTHKGGILERLMDDGDFSQWGYLNAFTRHSQDVSDYDEATEIEAAGGKILQMTSKDIVELEHFASV